MDLFTKLVWQLAAASTVASICISTNNYVGIYDQDDREVLSKKLPNDLPTVLRSLEPYRSEVVGIAVESTYNWYWLVDGLTDHGYNVVLANPAANSQDRKSTRLNSSHIQKSRMPSSA